MVSILFMKTPVLKSSILEQEGLDNITTITASFDRTTNKHQIDVMFSETVSRLLAQSRDDQQPVAQHQELPENNSADLCGTGENCLRGNAGKKSGGSMITCAADHTYSVTVE